MPETATAVAPETRKGYVTTEINEIVLSEVERLVIHLRVIWNDYKIVPAKFRPKGWPELLNRMVTQAVNYETRRVERIFKECCFDEQSRAKSQEERDAIFAKYHQQTAVNLSAKPEAEPEPEPEL